MYIVVDLGGMDTVHTGRRTCSKSLSFVGMRESYLADLTSDGSTVSARTCDRKSRPTMPDAVYVDAARRGGISAMQTSNHTGEHLKPP